MKIGKIVALLKVPLIITVLAAGSEYFGELFKDIPFRYKVPDNAGYEFDTSYRDAVWYFVYSLFILVTMVIIFALLKKGNIASRHMMLAPISWFTVEFYQKVCWLLKINDNRLYISDDSKWQATVALFIIFSSIYGLIRFKS